MGSISRMLNVLHKFISRNKMRIFFIYVMGQKLDSLCWGVGHNSSKRFVHIWDFGGKETVTRFPHCRGQRFKFALNISPVSCYRSKGQTRVGKPQKYIHLKERRLPINYRSSQKVHFFKI